MGVLLVRPAALLGLLAALAYLAGVGHLPTWVECAIKPVPVWVLAAWVLVGRRDGMAGLVGAGLVLSGVADVVLHLPDPRAFVPGLAGFLVAHLLYLVAFTLDHPRLRADRAVPFALYGVGVGAWLLPQVGDLAVPVGAYILVICAMTWRAFARWGPGWDRRAGALGALCFALSDTILAVHEFVSPFPGAVTALMVLYWLGQLGIAASAARRPQGDAP